MGHEIKEIQTKYYGIWIQGEKWVDGPWMWAIIDDQGGEKDFEHFPTYDDVENYQEWAVDENYGF